MTRRRRLLLPILSALISASTGASAFEPVLPVGARLTAERASALDGYDAPVASFDGVSVPSLTVEGAILRRSWRIEASGLTPLQVLVPLRQQLGAEGYEVIFECEATKCGGFDFRFGTEVLPGPNMYVNIARYRVLTAVRGQPDAPKEVVSVLVSATAGSAYVQVVTASAGADLDALLPETEAAPLAPVPPAVPTQEARGDDFEDVLLSEGRVILDDLDFGTGSSDLGAGPFRSLSALADLLAATPDLRIALVGHTDTVGGLEANIAVSRARARSVRDRLISQFGADPGRIDAEGMGYLAPIATNATEEGRRANRRVEAIVVTPG